MTAHNELDIRAVAGSVLETLNSLESYLTTTMNPNRVALADLGLETMGWTKEAYSPKAFDIWQKQHERDADDASTMHHLAIMHHARAFDTEAGKNASSADEDWKSAMSLWHRLHGSEAFWNELASKACSGKPNSKDVHELREALPQLLLGIHYDIALDEETRAKRKTRAKFHIALAQNAPFDTQVRTAARAAAYAKFIKAIPDHVWLRDELREEEVAKGTKVIVDYLLFDPGCPQALEDALRLQRRMQRARNIKWRSLDAKDPERIRILDAEKKDFEHWKPYFKYLVEMRDQLGDDVRENIASWYFISGDSLCAHDLEEDAVKCFETAVQVCADEEDRKKYLQRLVQTLAYVARAKAGAKDSGARAFCDKVRARGDLTVAACFLLAQAYLVLFHSVAEDDFKLLDLAEALCARGVEIEPDFDDLQADEYKEQLKSFRGIVVQNRVGARIRALLKQAHQAMEAQGFQEALDLLNQAEKTAKSENVLPKHNSIFWLRAQAYLALKRMAEAKRDAEAFNALLDKDSSASDVSAGKRLKDMILHAETMGDVKPLLERAKAAMESGRFADALPPLNEAAKKAPKNDIIYFLRCQAHAALGNIAEARADVKTVSSLAESEDDRKAAKKLEEMIARAEKEFQEFGGPEAGKLRQEAIAAFNGERHQEAIRLLRQAIDASKKRGQRDGAPKLRSELSQVMAGAAISLANSAQESIGSNISMSTVAALRKAMTEVKQMLEEAVALDRTNDRASKTLDQVRQMLSQMP